VDLWPEMNKTRGFRYLIFEILIFLSPGLDKMSYVANSKSNSRERKRSWTLAAENSASEYILEYI